MYLSESCRTAINLEKLCRTLKSLAEICSCMRGNWCIWRQSVGCGEFGLKLVWWKCEWPLVGQLRILGLTAAVIYVRPVQKKTAVVLYNWYFKESITSVLQQKKRGSFYAMVGTEILKVVNAVNTFVLFFSPCCANFWSVYAHRMCIGAYFWLQLC